MSSLIPILFIGILLISWVHRSYQESNLCQRQQYKTHSVAHAPYHLRFTPLYRCPMMKVFYSPEMVATTKSSSPSV